MDKKILALLEKNYENIRKDHNKIILELTITSTICFAVLIAFSLTIFYIELKSSPTEMPIIKVLKEALIELIRKGYIYPMILIYSIRQLCRLGIRHYQRELTKLNSEQQQMLFKLVNIPNISSDNTSQEERNNTNRKFSLRAVIKLLL